MGLPRTDGYKLTSSQPFLLNIVTVLMFTSFFTIFQLPIIGLILGTVLSFVLYIYQRVNSPGIINHYLFYNKLPNKLSGNKHVYIGEED